ncbi:MAG: N-acetylmuramoyl-L-alanine amidase [bacterium]
MSGFTTTLKESSILFAGLAAMLLCTTVCQGAWSQYSRDLRKIAATYGLAPPFASGRNIILSSSFTKMVFEEDARKMSFNGVIVWMNGAVSRSDNRWLLMDQDLKNVVHPLLRPDSAVAGEGSRTVVLDPGHGGKDQGTAGARGTMEKRVVLDVAKRVARKLQDSQVIVRMTRSTDTYLSLAERCRKAGSLGADVFVSIHANSAADRSVSGIESFVMTSQGCAGTNTRRPDPRAYSGNGHDPANMLLGYYVQKGLLSCSEAQDRGVKRARFEVLRDIGSPAVLVECGFLSNSREESKLNDPRYRDAVANGIARGILTYLSRARSAKVDLDRAARQARVTARSQAAD